MRRSRKQYLIVMITLSCGAHQSRVESQLGLMHQSRLNSGLGIYSAFGASGGRTDCLDRQTTRDFERASPLISNSRSHA